MSIITIATDAYSNGRKLAEEVARKMGYPCIGEEIVFRASKTYDVSEAKLQQALKPSPFFFSLFSDGKKKHMAYLEAELAGQMCHQDLVYHGFIGLPWLQKVSHILKVRVIANIEDRISNAIQEEKLQGKVEATDRIRKEDEERKQWGKSVYGIDPTDSSHYDLVVNIGHMGADESADAVEIIASAARHKKYQPMTYSQNCMSDIALSRRVKAAHIDTDADMEVRSDKGTVYIYARAFRRKKPERILDFEKEVLQMDGVEHVEVYVKKDVFEDKSRGH